MSLSHRVDHSPSLYLTLLCLSFSDCIAQSVYLSLSLSLCLCLCLSVCLSVSLILHLSHSLLLSCIPYVSFSNSFVRRRPTSCLSVFLALQLFTSHCVSSSASFCLSVCQSICLFVCLSICLYVCLFVCMSVCPTFHTGHQRSRDGCPSDRPYEQ